MPKFCITIAANYNKAHAITNLIRFLCHEAKWRKVITFKFNFLQPGYLPQVSQDMFLIKYAGQTVLISSLLLLFWIQNLLPSNFEQYRLSCLPCCCLKLAEQKASCFYWLVEVLHQLCSIKYINKKKKQFNTFFSSLGKCGSTNVIQFVLWLCWIIDTRSSS